MIGNANAANLPSTSANPMMSQPVVGAMSQQNSQQPNAMGMGPGPNAQRQPNQNASMMMGQGAMTPGNLNTLQQMKNQLAGNNMFGGGGGGGGSVGGVGVGVGTGGGIGATGSAAAALIQQRQVCFIFFWN